MRDTRTARQTAAKPAPNRFLVSPAPRRKPPVRAVGSFVATIAAKSFEKFGFSTATLLTQWPLIVGADIAAYSEPERIVWAKAAQGNVERDGTARAATLTVRVEASRALDMQYRERVIVERINAYFGYRAVGHMKLVQGVLGAARRTQAAASASLPRRALKVAGPAPDAATGGGDIAHAGVKAALARLEASLAQARS